MVKRLSMEPDRTLERLRETVEQTKALYEGAKLEYARQIQRMQDLGMAHPDGSIRHATKVYRSTLNAYHQALQRYNRYVLDATGATLANVLLGCVPKSR